MNTATATRLVPINELADGDVVVSNGERHTVRRITGSVVGKGRRMTVRWYVECYDGHGFRQDHGYQIKVAV